MAFLTVGWTSIIHILHVRGKKSIFRTNLHDNRPLVISTAFMVFVFGLLVATSLGNVFGMTAISGIHWLVVIGLSLLPTMVREIGRLADNLPHIMELRRRRKEASMRLRKFNVQENISTD